MPASGNADDTTPNRSDGARAILNLAGKVSLASRPLVIVTGGRLTDVADAYLMDHSIKDRVIVVSSLGRLASPGGTMGAPNGELDPWADTIVVTRFRYIQVSAYYDQTMDLPASSIADLPANAFGAWMAAKQAGVKATLGVQDQVAVIALGIPAFVAEASQVSPASTVPTATAGPKLLPDQSGTSWLVNRSVATTATNRLWQLLRDPSIFGQ